MKWLIWWLRLGKVAVSKWTVLLAFHWWVLLPNCLSVGWICSLYPVPCKLSIRKHPKGYKKIRVWESKVNFSLCLKLQSPGVLWTVKLIFWNLSESAINQMILYSKRRLINWLLKSSTLFSKAVGYSWMMTAGLMQIQRDLFGLVLLIFKAKAGKGLALIVSQ